MALHSFDCCTVGLLLIDVIACSHGNRSQCKIIVVAIRVTSLSEYLKRMNSDNRLAMIEGLL